MYKTLGQGDPLEVRDLGVMPYAAALELQHQLVDQRRAGSIPDTLLLLEHPAVITMGRSAVEADILLSPEEREARGVTVEWIERGGETTYHGPGQLVGYLILDLRQHLRSIRKFVYLLEEVFVQVLDEHYHITAHRDEEHRGVWVQHEKITALGIAMRERITYHGFAFNVTTDVTHYDWIVPCGITDRGQTSLQLLTGTTPEMALVKEQVAAKVAEVFGFTPASAGFSADSR